MADFQSQAMGLTGLTIDASSTTPSRAEFSTFLNDGVIDVTSKWLAFKPKDAEQFARVTAELTSNEYDLNGAKIISVVRENGTNDQWRSCRKITAAKQYDVLDEESLHYASKTHPAFMIADNNQVSVFPIPGSDPNEFKIYYVNDVPEETDGSALDHASTGIKWFPANKVHLVVMYAAIKSLEAKMVSYTLDDEDLELAGSLANSLASLKAVYTAAFAVVAPKQQ